MIWILILVLAHFFYAIVFIVDKYIISKPMPSPIVYAFWVGVLGIFILILIPLGTVIPGLDFTMPSKSEVFWSLIAGVAQIVAFVFFYKALNRGEVSRIVPFVGAMTSVFVLILSSLIIKEFLTNQQIIAFVLLVLGSFVIGFKRKHLSESNTWGLAIGAAFLFAFFWVTTKYLFLGTNFVSGLVWVRTGVAIIALTLLLSKKNRELIFSKTKEAKPKTTGFFMLSRVLNAVGSLFLYFAVFLGSSVSLTNAFNGLQYVFVLIIALLLFKKIPSLKEHFGREVVLQKIIAILLICVGLGLLVI